MRRIKLTKGRYALIDDIDFDLVSAHKWCVSSVNYAVKAIRLEDGKQHTLLMHRFIMNPPPDMQIDHINGNTLDNRRKNLRICTRSENQRNRHTHRAGRIKGDLTAVVNGKRKTGCLFTFTVLQTLGKK